MYNTSINSSEYILTADNLESFIRLLISKNICVFKIKRMSRKCISLTVLAKDEKGFIKLCQKNNIEYKRRKQKGINNIKNLLLSKESFVLLFIISFLLFFISRMFILTISIQGNIQVDDEVIIEYLKDDYVSYFDLKKNIDPIEISNHLVIAFEEITWAKVAIKSNGIEIRIIERNKNVRNPVEEAKDRDSLFSDRYGIIDEIVAKSGTPVVEIGDFVKPGDMLISNMAVRNPGREDESFVEVGASGYVKMQVEYEKESSMIITSEKIEGTGEIHKIFRYKLGNKNYSIGSENIPFDYYTSSIKKELNSDIWFSYSLEIYEEVDIINTYINEEKAIETLKEQLKTEIYKDISNNSKLISEDYSYKFTNTKLIMKLRLLVLDIIEK